MVSAASGAGLVVLVLDSHVCTEADSVLGHAEDLLDGVGGIDRGATRVVAELLHHRLTGAVADPVPDRLIVVQRHAELDDPEEDQEEDGCDERDLDEGGTTLAGPTSAPVAP